MIESGLALLVFLAPLFFLGVLMAVLDGINGSRGQWRRHPSKAAQSNILADDSSGTRPMLASDAEREEALRAISHAVGEGRVDLDDAGRRIDAVLRSRHRHELWTLVGDLPSAAPSKPGTSGRPSALHAGSFALAASAVVAAIAVQAIAGLWILWPVAVMACGLAAAWPRSSSAS